MRAMKKDNRGVTLMELMVAIMILGILMSPLLHSFVVAGTTNTKSQEIAAATNAATNFIEQVKASDVSKILGQLEPAGTSAIDLFGAKVQLASTDEEKAKGLYVMELAELSYGGHTYSGTLTLDAGEYKRENAIDPLGINDVPVVQYSFTGLRCGVEMSDVDVMMAETLMAEANVAALATNPLATELTVKDILKDMTRKMTLTVHKLPGANPQIAVTASCEYTYKGIVSAPFVQEYFGPYDEAIYFFYYPMYANPVYANPNAEDIVIENKDDLEFSFFLVKQKPWEVAKAMTENLDETSLINKTWMENADFQYRANASVNSFVTLEQTRASTSKGATIYSNIGVNIADSSFVTDLKYNLIENGSAWQQTREMKNSLVELTEANRIYKLKLELFDNAAPGERAVTIETTKLDFPNE